ncbi:hypothetical protein HYS31_03745 [Candidatus Woesearchaeota archaeon]|nr:hypothetical protein [Candidatus Woesearchaeota archaeon]
MLQNQDIGLLKQPNYGACPKPLPETNTRYNFYGLGHLNPKSREQLVGILTASKIYDVTGKFSGSVLGNVKLTYEGQEFMGQGTEDVATLNAWIDFLLKQEERGTLKDVGALAENLSKQASGFFHPRANGGNQAQAENI